MRQQRQSHEARTNSSALYTTQVTVKVTGTPQACIRLYRGGTATQEEVLTTGVVLGPDGSDVYPVRFVHDRTLEHAATLRPGDLIRVTKGRFRDSPGRRETELHVKDFHQIAAEN